MSLFSITLSQGQEKFARPCRITFLLFISLFLLLSTTTICQSVVINKYYNSGSTADKIELLVIQDNLDMRGMIIKNFSGNMAADAGGKFTFTNNSLWSSVKKGTLIVLSNDATTVQDFAVSCADHNLTVNLTNTTYFTNSGGTFDIGITDMIMIKAAGSGSAGITGSIHVLAGGVSGTEFTAAPAPKLIAAGTSGNNQFVCANNSTLSLNDFNGTDASGNLTHMVLGDGNNANNSAYIFSLRAVCTGCTTVPVASVPANQTYCNGTAVSASGLTFGTSQPGGGQWFNWTNTDPSIGLPASGGSPTGLPAFTATNTSTQGATATITVTPLWDTNGDGEPGLDADECIGLPKTFLITVNPTPPVTVPGNQVYCNGSSIPTGTISFTSTVPGVTFNWTNSNPSIGLSASGTGNSLPTFVATNATTTGATATITVSASLNGCSGVPNTFTILVNPTPVLSVPVNKIYCHGTLVPAATLSFSSTVTGTTYSWTNSNTSIGLAANGLGNSLPLFTATNTGTVAQTATITVIATANSCTSIAQNFTLTVYPIPGITVPAAQVFCAGSTIATGTLNFTSTLSGTTFNWTNSNTAIGLAASGSGTSLPAFTASNPGTSTISATITVTASMNGCASAPQGFTISVKPTPSLTIPSNQIYCNGTLVAGGTLNFSSNLAGTAISWNNSNTSIGLIAGGTGNSLPQFIATNSGTLPQVAIITISGAANGCTSTSPAFSITVNPTPVVSINPTGTIALCQGHTQALTASGGCTGYTFSGSMTGVEEVPPTASAGSASYTGLFNPGNNLFSVTINFSGLSGNSISASLSDAQAGTNGLSITDLPGFPLATNGTYTTTFTLPAAYVADLLAGHTYFNITTNTNPGGEIRSQVLPACSSTNYIWSTGSTSSSISVTTAGTYTVTGTNTFGCSANASVIVNITPQPNATISYPSPQAYCNNVAGNRAVIVGGTITGTGTFSSSTGLLLNPSTGTITPQGSTAGTYTVTYTVAASGGCQQYSTNSVVIINNPPTATIAYGNGATYCTNGAAVSPTTTTSGGGVSSISSFIALPSGLNINAATGLVNPALSTAGTYTITFTFTNTITGCATSTTTQVQVTNAPIATISYGSAAYCTNAGTGSVTLGVGSVTGGTYSAIPSGLSINPVNGLLTPANSAAGIYTVQYTTPTIGGCTATATTNVTITQAPSMTVVYSGSPYCKSIAGTVTPTFNGTPGSQGGTYSAPPGLSISSTGAIAPSVSTAGTYTITYTSPLVSGCSNVAFATVTITNMPSATISYPGLPFCTSSSTPVLPVITGTGGGQFSASVGLNINGITGAITPSANTAGSYIVTYTMAASGGCATASSTAQVIINNQPSATISYGTATTGPGGNEVSTKFCSNAGVATPTITGTVGGTFIAPAGVTINPITGVIDLAGSTANNQYLIQYVLPASGGCATFTASTSIHIFGSPTVTISYNGSPYCTSIQGNVGVSYVAGSFLGGTFSSAAGLVLNGITGAIFPSTSTAGTYTVTYTATNANGCTITTTANVVISALPVATISYAGTPYCSIFAGSVPVSRTGAPGGTYSSSPGGLSLNPVTGTITPSTSIPGVYTISYSIPSSGGCVTGTTTTTISIIAQPNASISYPAPATYCINAGGIRSIAFGGTVTATGTFSAVPAGLSLNASTGDITLAGSNAGTYTVSYTVIPAGCSTYTTSTSVTINNPPVITTLAYGAGVGSSFCTNGAPVIPTINTSGGGSSASSQFSSIPAGLNLNPLTGVVNPSASQAGLYTVTLIYTNTNNGCSTTTSAQIKVNNAPTAFISYSGLPYCSNAGTATPTITSSGGTATFTAPAGLAINPVTGVVNLAGSLAGTYTVTYTLSGMAGNNTDFCSTSATAQITITPQPNAGINYGNLVLTPMCTSQGSSLVIYSGTVTGTGNFSSSPAGLSINSATGTITPATSIPGIYTVTYTTFAVAGCGNYSTSTSVKITAQPNVSISYSGSPYCTSAGIAQVTYGGSSFAPGAFTSIPSLGGAINANTGEITLAGVAAGNYTITYTVAQGGGCSTLTTSTNITITAQPNAIISYSANAFCSNGGFTTASVGGTVTGTGTFSSSPSLSGSLNPLTGTINLATAPAGTYTIFYSIFSTGGCGTYTSSTSITINTLPNATIAYSSSPYCKTVSINFASPVFEGTLTSPGTFSSSPSLGGSLNPLTGQINLATAPPGLYAVNYTIVSAGCGTYTASASVRINSRPTGNITFNEINGVCNGANYPVVLNFSGTAPWNGTLSDGQGGTIPFTTNSTPYTILISPANQTIGQGNLTFVYTLSSLNDANCTSAPADLTGSAVITIKSSPKVIAASGGGDYCTGSPRAPISFNFSGVPTFTFTIQNLTDNSQFSATIITSNVFTFIPTTDGIYKVISLSDGSGCTASPQDMVITRGVQLLQNITPSVILSVINASNIAPGPSPAVCNNATSVTYKAAGLPLSPTNPGTFTFKKGATIVLTGASDTYTDNSPFSTGNPETITVEYIPDTIRYPCITPGTIPATSSISVTKLPAISYGIVGGTDQSVCPDAQSAQAISMSTLPSGGSGIFSYQWYYAIGTSACASGSGSIPAGYFIAPGNSTSSSYTPVLSANGAAGTFGPGSYTLAVFVSPAGAPLCGAGQFALNCKLLIVLPKPGVIVTPSNQQVCNNTSTVPVVFGGTVSGTTFSWTKDNNPIGGANSGTGNLPSFVAINTGINAITSVYTVIPTANGCPGNPTTFSITVNPGPSVTITPVNQNICNGSATSLISFSSSVPGTTYSWSRDNNTIGGVNTGTGNIPSFVAINNGNTAIISTYTVIATALSGCGSSSQTFTITVNPSPKVQLTGSQSVCAGSNATLSVNFQGTGSLTFSYSSNGTNTNTLNALNSPYQFSVLPAVTTTFKISAANDAQCASIPADINPSSATIFVKPLPTAAIQPGNNQAICIGSVATIPVAFTGTAPFSLTYTDGTSNFVITSVTNNTSLTVTPTTNTTYSLLTVTDANQCTGNAMGSAFIAVNPASIGGNTGADQFLCSSTNSGFLSLSGQTGTVIKWQRSTDGGITYVDLPTNTSTTQTFSNLGAGVYKYRVMVQSGVCAPVFSSPSTVTVNLIVLVSVNAVSATCNTGTNGQVNVVGSGGNPPLSYNLSGGTLTTTVTTATGVFTGLGAGNYTYLISGAAGCTGPSGTIIVNAPMPIILAAPGKQDATCFGAVNGSLSTSASGGTGTKTYAIVSGPLVNNTGQFTGAFTGLSAGTYSIQATDANGCGSNTQSVTINQPAQIQPFDVNLAADATNFTFINPTVTYTDLVYSIFMNVGNAATLDKIYLRKPSGYQYSFDPNLLVSPIDGTLLDNPRWSLISNPSPITYPGSANSAVLILNNDPNGVNQVPCSGVSKVSVRLTRITANNSTFTVTARNFPYSGEDGSHQVNNNVNLIFSAQ